MTNRRHEAPRCDRCRLLVAHCVCAAIPAFTLPTRLVLLLHFREAKKPTNTGRLAALALANSEVHVRGLPNTPLDLASLAGRRAVVLTPSDDACVLTAGSADTLVIPDGSWRQASKMARREPALRHLPRVKLAAPPPSLRTRNETTDYGMSTLAAIAHAIAILDDPHAGAALLALDHLVATRTLTTRGKSGTVPDFLSNF